VTDPFVTRAFPLIDLSVRSGGDGRTVEAYAAVWGTPVEIADQEGRYREQIAPTAFNAAIAARQDFPVMFSHGMTMYGTPSDKWSAPIGVTQELRADKRGLVSVWRADKTPAADEVLEMIGSGSVRGQSFQGKFTDSVPTKPKGGYGPDRRTGELPMVTRMNIWLKELGPTAFPYYEGATILGVRAADLAPMISGLDPAERAELVRIFASGTPLEGQPEGEPIPDRSGTGTAEQPADGEHSGRQLTPAQYRTLIRARIAARST
jgi:HK97 family phage prohead protease